MGFEKKIARKQVAFLRDVYRVERNVRSTCHPVEFNLAGDYKMSFQNTV